MALPHSIPDTQLGLSSAELHTFRQHQALALNAGPAASSLAGHSAAGASRGRGSSRSGASSRATSAASTAAASGAGGHRLLLDAGSLSVLGGYFERLMARIAARVDQLQAQADRATAGQAGGAATSIAAADAEIARMRDLLRQIDELEAEFDKVRHIRDIVKGFRARVDVLGKGLRR